MKTLKVCNKSFTKRCGTMVVPHELLEEGLELVKSDDAEELVRYGIKVRGMALPESIASTTSWQRVVVGLTAYGPEAFDLKKIEWCAFGAPHEAFLIITLIVRKRGLPGYWINNAIRDAHYSARKYEKVVYSLCKYADTDTVAKWLNTKDNPWYQIAGICACAENSMTCKPFAGICIKAYENLDTNYSGRFDNSWLDRKMQKIL